MSGSESALDLAAKRLERAVHILEQRLTERVKAKGIAGNYGPAAERAVAAGMTVVMDRCIYVDRASMRE